MAVEIKDEDWYGVKTTLQRLAHNIEGNGKPSLETRLRDYIDKRDAHKEANVRQDLQDLRDEHNDRHRENQKKFDRLFQLVYIGMGVMIALEAVGLFKR